MCLEYRYGPLDEGIQIITKVLRLDLEKNSEHGYHTRQDSDDKNSRKKNITDMF